MGLTTVVLHGWLAVVLAQGGAADGAKPKRIDDDAARASHEQMVRALAEIASHRDTHPFLGTKSLEDMKAQLAALPADAPLPSRLQLLDMVAYQELALGQTREAMERFKGALELATKAGAAKERQILLLHMGTACLRLGENENCVMCANGESCLLPVRGGGVHTKQEGSRLAMQYFGELLKIAPQYGAAKWLLNIAAMTVGEWPDQVPPAWLIPPSKFESDEPSFPRFPNIAHKLGLDDDNLSGGAIGDDFDGDGLLDLVTSCFDISGPMHFFRNNGDGTFTDRAKEAGLEGIVGGLNCLQADFNNDGWMDVLVLRGAWCKEHGQHPLSLLRNEGARTGGSGVKFVDVTFAAGLGSHRYPTQTASFGDYDGDGDLDLYVGSEASPGLPYPCELFRNNGDETFTDITATAGVANLRYAKAVIWGDYDEDGAPDLYVSNQGDPHRLYHNNRDGTFTDVAERAGVTLPLMSFPAWFFDYDSDGHLDLYVSSYNPQSWFDVAASWLDQPFKSELACLYHGDGKGKFTDVARAMGLTKLTQPMGSNFGDLDNDGWLDFYLGTGTPRYESIMPNVMYHNVGGRKFADVSSAGGFAHLQKGHGVVFADFDDDGDQDVFEQMGGALPGDRAPDCFYLNPGFGNHWLKVRLVGTRSNRCGIGARICCRIDEGGTKRSIYKHVNSGGTFGANPLRQEIGLGKATSVATLEVLWPTTGVTQMFRDVPADQCIEVTEGEPAVRTLALKKFQF